jgi:hypothetical protein
MTLSEMPPLAQAIPIVVGLAVTAAYLWNAYRTGKVGQQNSFQPTDRRTDPVAYWMGMATGGAFFLIALGWAAVHALRWLSVR